MTSKISLGAILLAVQCMLFSCISSSDETVTTYDDVAITSFTLGTIKCYRTTKASDGTDSTYSYTYSGSAVPMHIDQRNNTIYNLDSLVVGSNVSRVLVSIGTKNAGIVRFANLNDDGYTYYSSTDSVDLSTERTLLVTSSDGQNSREYTVKTVVHKEFADSFTWKEIAIDKSALVASLKTMKLLKTSNGLFLMGYDGEKMHLLKSADYASWTECGAAGQSELTAEATIAKHDNKLYLLDDGVLYRSEDGDNWEQVTTDASLAVIIGGYSNAETSSAEDLKEMYALSKEGKIMLSDDNGVTWTEDKMESSLYYDNTDKLPYSDISFVAVPTVADNNVVNVTMVGNKRIGDSDDTPENAVVWNKIVDKEKSQGWFYTNISWENHDYTLPYMRGLSAVYYADGIVAIGNDETTVPYSKMYYSPDHGATWHQVSGMHLPEGFDATNVAAMEVDGDGYIYVVSDGDAETAGQLWRGRKNCETWETPQTLFR